MYVAMFTSVRVSTSVLLRGVNDWPAPPPISIDLNYSEELWEWGRWQRSLSRTLEGSHFPLIPPLCSWNGHHIKGEISESGDFKIVVI